jgi:two-component sensor histidine kinase
MTRPSGPALLLVQEVEHRAQNLLATVLGLVRVAAAAAPQSVPSLVAGLERRIAALSRVHNLLARARWTAAELRDVAALELAPYPGQASLQGPPIRLPAEVAQALAIVLHELASNAGRHGALSRPEGTVSLLWQTTPAGVTLDWVEQGGPRCPGPPPAEGFGALLVQAHVEGPLAGEIHREWPPEGFRCVLTVGAEALAG